ncbi:MAG: TfoX/Sxy family protein [Cumulibacter sp.]
MTEEQEALCERIRAALATEPVTREVSMFGGRAFMVREKMLVSAGKDGSLLVRVPAERHAELLGRRGASQAEMGSGRDMGPGWIEVSAATLNEGVADPLAQWLAVALEHNNATSG